MRLSLLFFSSLGLHLLLLDDFSGSTKLLSQGIAVVLKFGHLGLQTLNFFHLLRQLTLQQVMLALSLLSVVSQLLPHLLKVLLTLFSDGGDVRTLTLNQRGLQRFNLELMLLVHLLDGLVQVADVVHLLLVLRLQVALELERLL